MMNNWMALVMGLLMIFFCNTAFAQEGDDGQVLGLEQFLLERGNDDPEVLKSNDTGLSRLQFAELELLAWLSRLAYCSDTTPNQYLMFISRAGFGGEDHERECRTWRKESSEVLEGWVQVVDQSLVADAYPDKRALLEHSNLVFTVHARQEAGTNRISLVFAFRGTTQIGADWRSNLRWLLAPLPGPDHYTAVADLRDKIVELAQRRASVLFQVTDPRFTQVMTGHSLGGGLAQLMAYSFPNAAAVVFNSTPVTAYESLVPDQRVNCEVPITRVEESGEFLQYARTLIRNFYKWEPNMHRLSFDFVNGRNTFSAHGMHYLARGLTDQLGKVSAEQRLLARRDAMRFSVLFRAYAAVAPVDCGCQHQRARLPLDELVSKYPSCGRYAGYVSDGEVRWLHKP